MSEVVAVLVRANQSQGISNFDMKDATHLKRGLISAKKHAKWSGVFLRIAISLGTTGNQTPAIANSNWCFISAGCGQLLPTVDALGALRLRIGKSGSS